MIIEFFSSTSIGQAEKKKWGKRKPGKPKVHRIAYLNVVIIIMIAIIFVEEHVFFVQLLGTLSKRGRQHQRREARKIFLRNPRILLSISLLWLPYHVCFWNPADSSVPSLDFSSWNVGHVWSSWSLVWAGRHKCQLYFTYSRALLFLNITRARDFAPAQCLDTIQCFLFWWSGGTIM